jgi:hypothetical protein
VSIGCFGVECDSSVLPSPSRPAIAEAPNLYLELLDPWHAPKQLGYYPYQPRTHMYSHMSVVSILLVGICMAQPNADP